MVHIEFLTDPGGGGEFSLTWKSTTWNCNFPGNLNPLMFKMDGWRNSLFNC